MNSLAASSKSKKSSCPSNRLERLRNSKSTMALMSSILKERKMTRSLRRFKNSGLKMRFVSSKILSRIFSYSLSAFTSMPNPIEVSFCKISAPTFEVMINMVFLKSIFLPRLSVNRPSSRTCSNN